MRIARIAAELSATDGTVLRFAPLRRLKQHFTML
jgi:hypothetical protein